MVLHPDASHGPPAEYRSAAPSMSERLPGPGLRRHRESQQGGIDKATLSTDTCIVPLPDLDDLIAEVDRTCTTAIPRNHAGETPNWIELLKTAAEVAGQLQALADDLVEEYVEHCRLHRSTWAEIGEALGVSRQAAQQR